MPITFITFVICTLALCGIFPFAGFFSKDEILATAGVTGYNLFKWVGLVGAFMTAAYMTRCVYLTFFGTYRGGEHGLAEAIDSPVGTHEFPGEDIDLELAVVGVPGAEVGAEQPGGLHSEYPESAAALAALEDPSNTLLLETTHAYEADHDSAVLGAGHDAHAAHDTGHGAHAAHDTGHGAHGAHDDHAEPHESPLLITGPLIVLAALAAASGFLLFTAAGFEPFKDWIENGQGSPASFPTLLHPEFSFWGAALSVGIALAGIVISALLCVAVYERAYLEGFTRRNVFARAGYGFLWNKYYLDDLYEKVVVAGISGPIARAAYWVNQNVIDAVVNAAGVAGRKAGTFVYEEIDQRVVDTIVNGAAEAAEGTGESLRPVQSGRVQQYGALLFGAAAIGALILILTV
jgi:NADH-quinone oxidoreductase subunit L